MSKVKMLGKKENTVTSRKAGSKTPSEEHVSIASAPTLNHPDPEGGRKSTTGS